MRRFGIGAFALAAALAAAGGAPAQNAPPDIPPPPNVLLSFTEEQLVAQMPERQRAIVAAARNARARFEALVEVSDLQLQDISASMSTQGASTTFALNLYEATIIAADRRLRSREVGVKPRDRLYKRFEQRLRQQIALLKSLTVELGPDHIDAGRDAFETAKRIRLAALASAIDADPAILRDTDDEET